MDRSNETPERYWVLRPFLHYTTCYPDLDMPRVILCAVCGESLIEANGKNKRDDLPLLMYKNNPICAKDALNQIGEHPVTPTYMKWLEEGDPRWWSAWFCECDGCEPLARSEK